MTRRRVRLTGTGLAVALVSAAVLTWGWWARYPELAITGAVGLAAVLTALGRAMSLPPVRMMSRERPDANVGGGLEVRLLAPDNLRPTGSWRLTDHVLRPAAAGTRESLPVAVPLGAVGYVLAAERRGEHVFGPCTAHWTDALGLVRAEQAREDTVTTWVRPRIDESVRLGDSRARPAGQPPSNSFTSGDVFYGLREYQPGDDVRLVDWRATARHAGQLIVRQYAAPDPVPVLLPHLVVLDARMMSYPGPAGGSAFEDAVEIVASLCAAGVRSDLPVICTTTSPADSLPAGGLDEILDKLAHAVWISGESRWSHEAPVDGVTVVTGTAGPDAPAWLTAIEGRPAVTMVRVGLQGADARGPASAPRDEGAVQVVVEGIKAFAPQWNNRELGSTGGVQIPEARNRARGAIAGA